MLLPPRPVLRNPSEIVFAMHHDCPVFERTPLRILFVLNGPLGGSTKSALELMGALTNRGHRLFVVLPPGVRTDQLRALQAVAEEVRMIGLMWWNKKIRRTIPERMREWVGGVGRTGWHVASTLRLARWIRRWNIDIVHTNTAVILDGALAARLAGLPHVWHIRELVGKDALFPFWIPDRLLARMFTSLSRTVIANSEYTAGFFRRQGPDGNLVVIPNAIEAPNGNDGDENGSRIRHRIGLQRKELLVGMVASLSSRSKRHSVFLEAAAQVASRTEGIHFVVFGAIPEQEDAYTRALFEQAQNLGLEGRLTWYGYEADVAAMMSAIDVLVHPAEAESFGRVVLEAMAMGKPVVGANSGGVAEIVRHGSTGLLVPPGDVHGFSRAILRICDLAEERAEMGKRSMEEAEKYSLRALTDRIESVYRSLT